jgi:translocation and assembly module TamB
MSDPETGLPIPEPVPEPDAKQPSQAGEQQPQPRRLRRFLMRHVPLAAGGLSAIAVLATAGLYFWMSSAQFEGMVRKRLIAELEQSTGGRVEMASFHWRILKLEADADGIVIHGNEAPNEAPYARIDRLSARIALFGFFSPSVRLRELDIRHPALHLIVYPDGSTNQPHSRKLKTSSGHNLDSFFDLQAGHISLEQGVIDYDSRAASFDFQNRAAPLDFQANDVSLIVRYLPATLQTPETYRIEAGATDLDLSRTLSPRLSKADPRDAPKSVHGYFQATLDLTRTAATLRSLRLTASERKGPSHTLEISGSLNDFTRPRWQAKVLGDFDLRLLDPMTGYPSVPEGIARLNLDSAGHAGEFRADGSVHVDNGSYVGTGVNARNFRFDAHVHADQGRLLVSSIVAAFHQGGQMEGIVDLSPWLPVVPGEAVVETAGPRNSRRNRAPARPPVPVPPDTIPVNGKVTAQVKNVSLDTILDMVSEPPFQRLGIGTLLNGPASAVWTNGDTQTVTVNATLAMSPQSQPPSGEVAGSGIIDGTYTQRNGAVDLRKLELNLPSSHLLAHGDMGAYPLSSPSVITVDFHSRNLGDFDTVLRSLGVKRNGKAGVAALPVALTGQGDLQGTWTGSLVSPHIAGNLKATQISLEMPSVRPAAGSQPDPTRFVHFDSVEASGSYSSSRIAIDHGLLQRDNTKLNVSGSLVAGSAAAAPGRAKGAAANSARGNRPSFDSNSVLHLRLQTVKLGVADVQPFLEKDLPVTGSIDADIQADGPLHTLGGSGWVQLDGGAVYGEPFKRVRAQGAIVNNVVNFTKVTATLPAGSASATGSFDLKSHSYQLDAKGSGIDIARIDRLRREQWDVAGKLAFSVRGAGTFADPQLEGDASLTGFSVDGESVGGVHLLAHAANRTAVYDVTTHMDSAELKAHGQTSLQGDYQTQARLEFSRFNIDSLLKLAHVKALSGESALAGVVTVAGPLAHIDQLRGEARLKEIEATVAGVHLKSQGDVHAIVANGRIRLDPLHVTGEDTDLRAEGTLLLTGTRQLDLAASGSVNLKLAETLDPDLTASGSSTFQVEAHGPLKDPGLRGKIDFQNGALSFEGVPNGLSQLHGTLEFNQDRLEVRSLTAMSGGGPLTVGGYLAYQHGIYADLTVAGKGVRIRYPQGVSSLADATLHLQGSQSNLQLSGNVLITRFTVSPDLDFVALAAQANSAPSITPPDAPSNHVRLDVRILSSPQLNFQNAFAKLAGDVDLRLRGTLATPSLLGRISITEGSAMIAGTRYDLQRGDISFTNPVRIEPVIDLSATARVSDYDITLGLHGTPSKPSVTYRSDPPLPESDVVALLALGRTSNQQRIYTQQQEQALSNPTTDALLGGALNATVSSRIQKLFGAGSVKVDPNYLGPFGNSTSRIIVEEQLGRNVTLLYATDVNTTGQQLLQAEININRHVSLLVARDESGVFSMVVKATRRFR